MLVALSACWLAPWTIDCEVWPMDWEVSWSSSLSWRMMVIICRRSLLHLAQRPLQLAGLVIAVDADRLLQVALGDHPGR